MSFYQILPSVEIRPVGKISKKFLELDIKNFKEACRYVHNIKYGYNSNYDDDMILFKENKGSCTTKHAVIAGLARELGIPVHKHVGIYKFTEEVSDGVNKILEKYKIPYIPMVHCFLIYDNHHIDLTVGNNNGKKTVIKDFLHVEKVDPFISRKDEYLLFKKILREKILKSKEMEGIKERTLLKAREEAIILLKKLVEK